MRWGASAWQCGHQVAKNSRSTVRPLKSERRTRSPVGVSRENSGACAPTESRLGLPGRSVVSAGRFSTIPTFWRRGLMEADRIRGPGQVGKRRVSLRLACGLTGGREGPVIMRAEGNDEGSGHSDDHHTRGCEERGSAKHAGRCLLPLLRGRPALLDRRTFLVRLCAGHEIKIASNHATDNEPRYSGASAARICGMRSTVARIHGVPWRAIFAGPHFRGAPTCTW